MVTRRALLGAGATALVAAGCGPAEEPEIRAADVLAEQIRAEQAVVAAHEAVGLADTARSRTLLARTRARIATLDAALRDEGGAPGPPPDAPGDGGLETVLAAERDALRVHVRAVGQLQDGKWRALLAELVAGSAAHETALLEMLERPSLPTAFPGQPVA